MKLTKAEWKIVIEALTFYSAGGENPKATALLEKVNNYKGERG